MNPFQVLGLDPDAPHEQVEATYRHLLRAHHPDLHHEGSPDELAEAERQRTQELNQAMALIRAGWRPRPEAPDGFGFATRPWPRESWAPPRGAPAQGYEPPPSASASWSDGFQTDDSTDFFGNPEPAPAGAPDSVAVSHVRRGTRRAPWCCACTSCTSTACATTPSRDRARRGRAATASDGCAGSRWPQLTLSALLFVYLVLVDGLVPAPWTIPGLWLGFGLYAGAMYKAMSQRRWQFASTDQDGPRDPGRSGCNHAPIAGTVATMSRVIQIRDVPDDVHDALPDAAAAQGLSLTRIRGELSNWPNEPRSRDNAAVVRQTQAKVRRLRRSRHHFL